MYFCVCDQYCLTKNEYMPSSCSVSLCLVRPRTSVQERTAVKTVSSKPPRSVKTQGGKRSASNMGVGMQDEMGMGPEQDSIVDLLNAPDRDFHSRIHSSGIGSGTAPSFPRYVLVSLSRQTLSYCGGGAEGMSKRGVSGSWCGCLI